MANLQLVQISLAYGNRDILKEVSLHISEKSRIALAGANGCGKSTLLKILAGLQDADSGQIVLQQGARIGYLPQTGLSFRGRTLRDEAEQAYSYYHNLEKEADSLGTLLQKKTSEEALHRLHDIHEELERSGYYHRQAMIEQVLSGLGFAQEELENECSTFSGGWQMRIALAKVLLQKPDFLLLDEPTNYLDLEAREWLSPFLQSYPGGILIVSHDRYFLDSLVQNVAEVFLGKLKLFKGSYTQYQKFREEELERIQEAWKQQQEEISRIEDFIRRFRYKDSKAAQVQSRVKMLEKMERIEIPENLRRVSLQFPQPPHSGKDVLMIRSLSKSYGDKKVLSDIDLDLERGTRLVIAGVNGAGKTTLLKILAGEIQEYQGEIRLGSGVKVGYFAQDQDEQLNPEHNLLEELETAARTEDIPKLRAMAGSFLFSGDDVFKKVSFLSGGEKNRLALLKMLLKPFNLLILDEPTNHLDIHSKDILLQALKGYEGTLIFVSHDRSFIEGLADRVLELKPGSHQLFLGDYSYYQWKLAGGIEKPAEKENTDVRNFAPQNNAESRQEEKQLKALIRRLSRKEEELMGQIGKMEEEIAETHRLLSLEENYSDPDKAHELSQQQVDQERKLEELTADWEKVDEELQQYL